MPVDETGRNDGGQEGLSFANALRDCLVCGLILINGNTKTVRLTPAAAQILGLNPGEAPDAAYALLPEPLRKIAAEALASGRPVAERLLELESATRGTLTLRLSAVPAPLAKADAGVALLVNDLTAAHRLEAHLNQLDRLARLGTLTASLAHEIKNALVAGKTLIDLLLEKNQNSELVEVVRRELSRIDAIVTRMLKFGGPSSPAFATVSLHEVLGHALRLIQHQADGSGITLTRSFQAAPDMVQGDDRELEQVFLNLLLNALDAMGSNGTLTVATALLPTEAGAAALHDSPGGPSLRITIKDTGMGIPPESLGHLFEPFFTTKPSGTGLGLAITRRIIREHHGTVTAHSRPGEGTTFEIVLPALAT
jgi:two-component system sensor histidine kinase HydH